MFDPQHAFQHNRELVELGSLAGLEPSLRAAHVGHAGGCRFGVDASNILVDEFGLVACGLNARGLGNESGHGKIEYIKNICAGEGARDR